MATTTRTVAAPTTVTMPLLFPVAMIVAPILLMASTFAFLSVGGGINDGIVGGVLTVWAVMAFVLAFVGCARILESRMPKGAQLLAFGAAAVGAGGAGFGISAIYVQLLREDHAIDGVAAVDAHPFAILALLPWGWFMPLTCILVGALLWRARLLPWWHGVLFILAGALFVTGRPAQIGAIAVATDVVFLAAFVGLGLRTLAARSAAGRTERS
ncbi:hypothetical protein EXU48_11155 [Occultella glacieicola]|uniref:Uncharacterized protein n=1 Tax=Occultella glacieicola TaxID=2518684 RepID=A0ABY2E6S4_9MICO|nr:hypothetical protein [Occultella glacieicola]TDE94011.1 hypothetical protein EXU48_11155 [Occultella glacieicola]